jgi:hypothetical protein
LNTTKTEGLDDMLRSHAIEPEFLRQDDFEGFFAARTKALMELIGKAMGKPLIIEPFEPSVAEYKNGNGNRLHPARVTN